MSESRGEVEANTDKESESERAEQNSDVHLSLSLESHRSVNLLLPETWKKQIMKYSI